MEFTPRYRGTRVELEAELEKTREWFAEKIKEAARKDKRLPDEYREIIENGEVRFSCRVDRPSSMYYYSSNTDRPTAFYVFYIRKGGSFNEYRFVIRKDGSLNTENLQDAAYYMASHLMRTRKAEDISKQNSSLWYETFNMSAGEYEQAYKVSLTLSDKELGIVRVSVEKYMGWSVSLSKDVPIKSLHTFVTTIQDIDKTVREFGT